MARTSVNMRIIGGNNKDRIGGSCTVLEYKNFEGEIFREMFDLGAKFAQNDKNDEKYKSYIVDLRDYLSKPGEPAKYPIDRINLSHVHEDHIGAIIDYLRMGYEFPEITGSKYTIEFLKNAIQSEGFTPPKTKIVEDGDIVRRGNFEIEYFNVTHSCVDALGMHVLVKDDNKKDMAGILMPGDFYTEEKVPFGNSFSQKKLDDLLDRKRVDYLMLDSTSTDESRGLVNVTHDEAVENMAKVLRENADRDVYIPMISRSLQHFGRYVESVAKIGNENNIHKKIFIDGMSLRSSYQMLLNSNYSSDDLKNVPSNMIHSGVKYSGFKMLTSKKERVHIVTGSQAELNSSMSRVAKGVKTELRMDRSSLALLPQSVIPGNEADYTKMMKDIVNTGAKIVMNESTFAHQFKKAHPKADIKIVPLQRTGHITTNEAVNLMTAVGKKNKGFYVLPVHGDMKQIKSNAMLAYKASDKLNEEGIEKGVRAFITPNSSVIELGGKPRKSKGVKAEKEKWIGVVEYEIGPRKYSYEYYQIKKGQNDEKLNISSQPTATMNNHKRMMYMKKQATNG